MLKRGRFQCHNQGRFGIPCRLKQEVRCSGTRTSYENDIEIVLQQESVTEFATSLKYRTVPCGRAVHRAVARSTKIATLTSHPRGCAMGPCGHAGVGRMHLETLPGTREVAR
ncbi:hypothetical protein PIB30_089791 [Stylosanthes scabra]|uniref:Uncharacterized protein n=1 Tax=Stylosanthes scabra TaxID=79078 RepID=A0ABU6ZSR1_9FABA|nr:hypothetical protein [Stylosanthes scabra]